MEVGLDQGEAKYFKKSSEGNPYNLFYTTSDAWVNYGSGC